MYLNAELPTMFVLDNMHGMYLGVAKDVTGLWIKPENHAAEYYIAPAIVSFAMSNVGTINKNLLQHCLVTDYLREMKIPAFLKRCPRNLRTDSWKASEWRSWTLYFSLPILSKIFTYNQAKFLNHWANLSRFATLFPCGK